MTTNFFYIKAESEKRKNRRAKRKQKELNLKRTAIKKQNKKRRLQTSVEALRNGRKIHKVTIPIGESISLFYDSDNVMRIVNLLDKYSLPKGLQRHLELDMSSVRIVDIGALSLLLAKVNEITKSRKVIISGNFPLDNNARDYIEKSGFLDYMIDLTGRKFERHSDNFLVRIGDKKTDNENVGYLIKKCMKVITGTESHYPPVFSIIQEMSGNSVEHANIDNKNWLLGVNFQRNDVGEIEEVLFTMVDVGFGILNTINRKWSTLIYEGLKLTSKTDILFRAFERKYGSSTEEINRNRGLPLIKTISEKKQIIELKVITNNVFLDFENTGESKVLRKGLPGTFYCWKINKECIETWNKKTI